MSAIPASSSYTYAKSRKRARPLTVSLADVAVYSLFFAILVGITWIVSSLAGNVMVEKARRECIQSAKRAREARSSVVVLRRSIDSMTTYSAISDWATSHGFCAPDQSVHPSSMKDYVASNR